VTAQPTSNDRVVIERVLAAPRDLVWQMWVDPTHFAAWYGPTGARIPLAEFDLRPTGTRRVCMDVETPNGSMTMWFGGRFETIDPPSHLEYTEFISDERGQPVSPQSMGMPGDHPLVTTIIVDLEDLGDRTRMTMTHVGIPDGSPGASGWTMAFDKLEAALSR
jgi:uncharacterized protein YndB with AHSA1/START domain